MVGEVRLLHKNAPARDEFTRALEALNLYFEPQINVPFERSVFRRCEMEEGETVLRYVTRLRRLAVSCDFPNEADAIRDQVIEKVRSTRLRRKFLEEGARLTLERLTTLAQAEEAMNRQVRSLGGMQESEGIAQVRRTPETFARAPTKAAGGPRLCFRCGRDGHMAASLDCPARDKQCRDCKRNGHFAGTVYCKGQQKGKRPVTKVHTLTEETVEEDSADEGLFNIQETVTATFAIGGGNSSRVSMLLEKNRMHVLVDSGACANLLDRKTARVLERQGVRMKPTSRKLHSYGNSSRSLDLLGEMTVRVETLGKRVSRECVFYVYNGTATTLLGSQDATALGVLRVGDVECMKDFPKCFEGLGKLKGPPISIHVDQNVNPVSQSPRRIPYGYQEKVKTKLGELLSLGVIETVEGPTSWVSPLVVVPKDNGDVRLCVDMRQANTAVVRERHPMPTIKEMLQNLNGARFFSKIDLNLGFHQCELEEASRDITTFSTPWGLYRYRRLMFGITSAPEVYQYTLRKALSGLEGCQNYSDDIIVYAGDKVEHDRRLHAFMKRAEELGITLNAKKCVFGLTEIEYLGFRVSAEGISVSPKKVEAIRTAREPKSTQEVAGFMGLVKWVGRFLPDLSSLAEPLMGLCRKGVAFVWDKEQAKAFRQIKQMVGDVKTLAYFDPNGETFVVADASPHGLGAVLYQRLGEQYRVVEYAHRSLTSVERRYSQTEKEALGLVYACEHFYMYLAGRRFTLITDHKPLQSIFGNASSKPTLRLERWALRLMAFEYTIRYEPGPTNIADPLSRLSTVSQGGPTPTEEYVRVIAAETLPSAVSWDEVQKASLECPEMELVRKNIRSGDWRNNLPAYRANRIEFCECDGVILRDTRIVAPTSLRDKFITLAHEGHQGIVKTKQRLRCHVWWPGMDRDVERVCRGCFDCQVVAQPTPPEPLVSTRLPERPWEHLALDLMGPLPTGEHVIVMVDYFSRYYEVGFTRSTTTRKIIDFCESVFSRWGTPLTIRTDNGPQFAGSEFQEYLKQENVRWISTTPLWPRANGEVERQNRSILKSLKIAALKKVDYKAELRRHLVAYRSTPHSSTGATPFELMTGRRMRTKLLSFDGSPPTSSTQYESVRDTDALAKLRSKEAADKRRGAVSSDIAVGDTVLLDSKRQERNKLSPTYEPIPYQVVARQGSEVVCEDLGGHEIRRNVSNARKLVPNPATETPTPSVESHSLDTPARESISIPAPTETPRDTGQDRPKRNTRPPAWLNEYDH